MRVDDIVDRLDRGSWTERDSRNNLDFIPDGKPRLYPDVVSRFELIHHFFTSLERWMCPNAAIVNPDSGVMIVPPPTPSRALKKKVGNKKRLRGNQGRTLPLRVSQPFEG